MSKWGECAIIVDGEYFIIIRIIKFSNRVIFWHINSLIKVFV